MNIVMTMLTAKDTYIQVRVREDLKDDIRITAEARGLTISALIHSLLTQAVRSERAQYPHLFEKHEHSAHRISPKTQKIPVLKEKAK